MGGQVAIDRRGEIERAQSVAEVKDIRDKVAALQRYASASGEGRTSINNYAEDKVRAEIKGGLLLRDIERNPGERTDVTSSDNQTRSTPYQQALSAAALPRDMAHRWEIMSWFIRVDTAGQRGPEDWSECEAYFAKQRQSGKIITSEEVFRLGKKKMPHETMEPAPIDGKYSVIVIDPPWQMEKIERDVAPNQAGFDYPTMSEEELADENNKKWGDAYPPDIADESCHLFLWTTHKHYPSALRLAGAWGFKYVCTFVWHKPGGFQPFGLPQYNCEFVVYARKGAPKFSETRDFFTCFNAPRREHSRKPEVFYETIARVTGGRRIDMFSREHREGFDSWGNQAEMFDA